MRKAENMWPKISELQPGAYGIREAKGVGEKCFRKEGVVSIVECYMEGPVR